MDRRVAGIVVAAGLASLLFAFAATSGGVNLWTEPSLEFTPGEPQPLDIEPEEAEEVVLEPFVDDELQSYELPGWLEAILQVLVSIVLIITAVALARLAWQERPRLRWRRRARGSEDFDVLPDIAAAVAEQAQAQRNELAMGSARNAIVRCWLRLEEIVEETGMYRRPSYTSTEFTEQVLSRYVVDAQAITDLGQLYREARFSDHPLGEDARQQALDALDRLHAALGESAERREPDEVTAND